MEEFVDIIDEGGNLTGRSIPKKEAHKKGIWHQAAHLWIFSSKGELLLQKRAICKDSFPGLWDISAAGHVSAGEKPETSLLRELSEELGLHADPKDLKKVFTRKIIQDVEEKGWHNREMAYVYIWKYDGDISRLKLQEEEVGQVKLMKPEDLESELKDAKKRERYVPHGDYYHKIVEVIRKEIRRI